MALVVVSPITEGTCYPNELEELLELFAEHLSAPASTGGYKTLYIQASQPTGVPEETMWLEPVSKLLKFYGRAPGDLSASWMAMTLPAASVTGSMLAEGTLTARELSADVLAQLQAASAATANSVLALETFHGGGSFRANFFIMADGTVRATGLSKVTIATVDFYKNGTGFVTSADASVLPKRAGFSPPLAGDTAARIYAMQSATFALTAAGKVYACGQNSQGQLGLNDTAARVVFSRLDPAYFDGTVVELAIGSGDGGFLSCYALTSTGKVYSWGHNYYGQLGLGGVVVNNTNQPQTPTYIAALGTDNAQIVAAGAGTDATTGMKVSAYVRKTGGTVYGCGYNADGQLGQGNATSLSSFTAIPSLANISHIAATGDAGHVAFFASEVSGVDGKLWSIGYNNKGQLGIGSTTSANTAQLAATFTGILVDQLKPFSTAGNFSTYVLLADGTVRVCGSNANKQLGLGAGAGTANQTSLATPTIDDADSNLLLVADIQAGGSAGKISAAVLAEPATGFNPAAPTYDVYTAGSNQYGGLGIGNTTDAPDFTQVLIDTSLVGSIAFGANHGHATANIASLLIRLQNGLCLACGWDGAANGQLGVDATPAAISVPAIVNF